jgi:thiamine pyrophosphate-dependent acetolactate synthase large subunit-like protein
VRGIEFVGLDLSVGCGVERVDDPRELARTLRYAFQSRGPILVDVVV